MMRRGIVRMLGIFGRSIRRGCDGVATYGIDGADMGCDGVATYGNWRCDGIATEGTRLD